MEGKEKIVVSLAQPDDARAIQQVFYKTWLDTYPNEEFGITIEDIEDKYKDSLTEEKVKERVEKIINPPEGQTLFVAKEANNLVGVCRVEKNNQGNRLRTIYVAPEYQGRGVGSLLWEQAKNVLDMSKDIVVDVVTYNTKAIEFYKKLGFIDTGKRFSDDKFTMKSGATIPEMEMVIRGNRTKIKNIIFDLAEVLLTGAKDTGHALAEKHQLNVNSEHKADWAIKAHPLLIPLVKEFFNGNVREDEYIAKVVETYPQIGNAETLKQHIRDNFKEIDGTRDVIIKLKKLGYKMAVLSVHGEEWVDYLEKKFDYHKLFDVRVYSYEAKVSKPDPLSFKYVLEKLNALPEECLFIDDSQKNIDAAEKLGIQTILFTNAEDLEVSLKRIIPI